VKSFALGGCLSLVTENTDLEILTLPQNKRFWSLRHGSSAGAKERALLTFKDL
jgi:hypothetical protein